MAIYIKGVEMPKTAFECSTKINPEERRCNYTGKVFEETYGLLVEHTCPDCPLVYIPEPHGRLIDADVLEDRIDRLVLPYKWEIEDRIDNAPTVKNLPSADRPSGEWKPVSEELPQRVGSYLVTCKGEHGSVYVDYDYWTVSDEFKYNRDKVTAWIPFPKPYCVEEMKGEK